MTKTNLHDNSTIDLSSESLAPEDGRLSFDQALARGVIVEVTDWVTPNTDFGQHLLKKRFALTAKLWDTLLQSYVRAENERLDRLYRDQGNDVLKQAALALSQSCGANTANFSIYLKQRQGIESCRNLRVEIRDQVSRQYVQFVIGFQADFERL